MDGAVEVFFSYSHKDKAFRDELEGHLEPLRLNGFVKTWYDGCIAPGQEWDREIKQNLQQAQVILLLISSDFISSRYCQKVELAQAIQRHEAGDACVIPIILRSCLWRDVPFGSGKLSKLRALPQPLKPVKSWDDQDEAFTSIAEGIKGIIEQLRSRPVRSPVPDLAESVSVAEAAEQQPLEISEPKPVIVPQRSRQWQPDYEYEDNLRSETGIDYSRLRDLLKGGKWKEADKETADQMLKAMGKDSWLDVEAQDLLGFLSADLLTINSLWVKYSKGRFGFSVQKEIYIRCGAKLDGKYPGNEIWGEFCDTVGWRVRGKYISYLGITFSIAAPQGHLPRKFIGGIGGGGLVLWERFSSLASRLAEDKR
ncbi:hypothetical protein C7271_17335 [filamentous cyanobacterium CCP5]|nr:hypothetical protein C7271_17335 [filamentous cyanobacterium CCP5]